MKTRTWYGFTVLCENIPTKRAGVYMITHILTGMVYIGISGNLEKRIREHNRPSGAYSKLGKAISECDSENFLVTPLYYALDNSADGLTKIESALIDLHDSIRSGFNVVANSSKAGKRGEAFQRAAKAAHNTPEYLAKMRKILSDPEQTKKRGDAIRLAHSRPETKEKLRQRRRSELTPEGLLRIRIAQVEYQTQPEVRARKSEAMKRNHADPEFKSRHLAGIRTANADPVRNSKIAESRTGGMWVTNGLDTSFIRSGVEIPDGWRRGQTRLKKAA